MMRALHLASGTWTPAPQARCSYLISSDPDAHGDVAPCVQLEVDVDSPADRPLVTITSAAGTSQSRTRVTIDRLSIEELEGLASALAACCAVARARGLGVTA